MAPNATRGPVGPVVLYQAEWSVLGDGVCRQGRRQAVALAKAGVRVTLKTINYPERDAPEAAQREVEAVRQAGSFPMPLAIRQTVIHDAGYLENLVKAHGVSAADSIVATWWERDRVDGRIIQVLRRCAELWVTCERNRAAFVTSGMPADKVHVVRFPLASLPDTESPPPAPPGRRFYNIGKWEPRKNQHGLIGAFLGAFGPHDDARLLIKTRAFGGPWAGYPCIADSLRQWIHDRAIRARGWDERSIGAKVRVCTDNMPDAQIASLHTDHNIYVSAGHGEALDIPALEAKQQGNRLVHVGFGGSEDYSEPEDVRVPWTLGRVHPGYHWEPDAHWATYSPQALSAALLQAVPRSSREGVDTLAAYSDGAVAQQMRQRIMALAAARDRSGGHLGVLA